MAAPVPASVGAYLTGGVRTTSNVPVPSGVASGDIVYVDLYLESTVAVTGPAGAGTWAEITTAPTTTGTVTTFRKFWKRANAADTGVYAFTHASSYSLGVATRVTGAIATGTPHDTPNAAARSSNGTTTPGVTVTTAGADRLLMWSGCSVGAGAWTPPTAGGTWTEQADNSTEVAVATKTQATAGTTGSVTGGGPNGFMCAWLVAVIPATASAPVVGAGTDATINLGATFNRVATESGSGITARQWKIQSGPSNVGDVLDTDATLAWVPGDDGVWVLRYSATNPTGTGTDDVTVTVNPVAPVVGAGSDATAVPTYQVFSRTATEDNKGNAVSARAWTVVSGPAQVGETIGTALALAWTPMYPGTYVLRYAATNIGGVGTDDVSVAVVLAPPEVTAGSDVSFVLGSVFNRNAGFVGLPTEIVGWTVVSGPSNVGNNLSAFQGISWVPPFLGTYVLRFTASNTAGSDTDDVSIAVTPPPAPEDPPEDEYSYINVPWGVEVFTLRDQLPGQQYEFQIRAVDIYNTASDWSAPTYAQSEPDALPPSIPAAASVAASRIAVQVTHLLGKSTGGTYNLEPDLSYIKVYILSTPDQATDDISVELGGTVAGTMKAGIAELILGAPLVGTFPIPQTGEVWVAVSAVDNYGNESGRSQAVQATAELIDDAYISNLTVTKVTAGTITSNWVMAAEMSTGAVGSRVRFGYFGIELYNDDDDLVLDANTSDGSLFLVGTISTAVDGRRVVIDGIQNNIRFTPEDNSDRFGQIFTYVPSNYPDDIAIEMRAVDSDESDFFARMYLLPDQLAMGVNPLGSGGDIVSKTRILATSQSADLTASNLAGTAPWADGDDTVVARVSADDGGSAMLRAYTTGGDERGRIQAGTGSASLQYSVAGDVKGSIEATSTVIQGWADNVLKWRSVTDGLEVFNAVYTTRIGGISNGRVVYKTDISGTDIFFYDNGGTVAMARTTNQGVSGTFVKNFVIPHPTAEDKWLIHGCTESPHAGVEYWGEAIVEDGEVEVPLPGYFEDLTRQAGRAVFLTVIAEDDPEDRRKLNRKNPVPDVIIPEDDNGNQLVPPPVPPGRPSNVQATYPKGGSFTIFSEGPVSTFRVWWMVKAIRADVPELKNEPLKSEITVHGEDGPYRWYE